MEYTQKHKELCVNRGIVEGVYNGNWEKYANRIPEFLKHLDPILLEWLKELAEKNQMYSYFLHWNECYKEK